MNIIIIIIIDKHLQFLILYFSHLNCPLGANKYSKMAYSPESRKNFIESVIELLLEYNFDGLEIDWEYPGT